MNLFKFSFASYNVIYEILKVHIFPCNHSNMYFFNLIFKITNNTKLC